MVSVFALMRLVMAPFVGRLVNALGERLLLAVGIGVVAVSSALAGLSQSYWQLLVLRGAGGIGSIMFSVSAASLLVRVTPSHLRGRAQGVWAGAFLIGLVAGPAVGTVATFSLRLPFFLYAGTLVVAGLLGLGALRHSELAARQSDRSEPLALSVALHSRAYLAALAAAFAGEFALIGARSAMVPLYVRDSLHLSASWAYAAFLIVSLVSGALLLPTGKVADTIGRRPVVIVGLLVGAVAFLLLPGLPAIAGLVVATALIGRGGGVRLRGTGRDDGRRRGGPGRHGRRGLPDGRRPRPRPRPRRDRTGGRCRRLLTGLRRLRRRVRPARVRRPGRPRDAPARTVGHGRLRRRRGSRRDLTRLRPTR